MGRQTAKNGNERKHQNRKKKKVFKLIRKNSVAVASASELFSLLTDESTMAVRIVYHAFPQLSYIPYETLANMKCSVLWQHKHSSTFSFY